MNKLSKIFLIIILLLMIALGIMTYYMFYWREGYLSAANTMVELVGTLEESGVELRSEEDGANKVIIKQPDKVVIETNN